MVYASQNVLVIVFVGAIMHLKKNPLFNDVFRHKHLVFFSSLNRLILISVSFSLN